VWVFTGISRWCFVDGLDASEELVVDGDEVGLVALAA
jgi:hypothetical protein